MINEFPAGSFASLLACLPSPTHVLGVSGSQLNSASMTPGHFGRSGAHTAVLLTGAHPRRCSTACHSEVSADQPSSTALVLGHSDLLSDILLCMLFVHAFVHLSVHVAVHAAVRAAVRAAMHAVMSVAVHATV